jgi:hypothetical protein
MYAKITQVNAKMAKLYKEDGPKLPEKVKSYASMRGVVVKDAGLLPVYNPGMEKAKLADGEATLESLIKVGTAKGSSRGTPKYVE